MSGLNALRRPTKGKPILLFEDKLGITPGYEGIWQSLLLKIGFIDTTVIRRNTFKSLGSRVRLLTRSGNRKAPGFNPDTRVQMVLRKWVEAEIKRLNPALILCMDPALLFILNPDWDQATLDKLRGGVYRVYGVTWLVMLPISAWHQKKSDKDIARLNDGFTSRDAWEKATILDHVTGEEVTDSEEDDEDDDRVGGVWLEPVVIPSGQFILTKDLEKARRLYIRETTIKLESTQESPNDRKELK